MTVIQNTIYMIAHGYVAKTCEITRNFLPPILHLLFITDNATNNKTVYKNDLGISCAGHNCNLMVTAILKSGSAGPVNETINTTLFLGTPCTVAMTKTLITH